MEYTVNWTIEVDTEDGPVDAAIQAANIMQDTESTACHFTVSYTQADGDGETFEILAVCGWNSCNRMATRIYAGDHIYCTEHAEIVDREAAEEERHFDTDPHDPRV